MRIVVVTHYFPGHRGGIEIVAGQLVERLGRRHKIVWAASDCDPTPGDLGAHVRYLPMQTTNFIERAMGIPYPLWGPRSVARLWRECSAADVVHLHDFLYFGNLCAFISAVIRRIPVFVTQHVGFIPYRNPFLRAGLRLAHAVLGRLVLGHADQVVFISQSVRDYFGERVRFIRTPLLIPNGVDTEMFASVDITGRAAARLSLNLDAVQPVLLFVGRFVEKKGLHIMKELVPRFPDAQWVFAGWGPMDPESWGKSNLRVLRGRGGSGLVPVYQAADLLVLPSVGEGFPLVVQEAMSCGTPVLVGSGTASALPGAAPFIFSADVAKEGTVPIWEMRLKEILGDKPVLEQMRTAVASYAREHWSMERCEHEYEGLLARLGEIPLGVIHEPRR